MLKPKEKKSKSNVSENSSEIKLIGSNAYLSNIISFTEFVTDGIAKIKIGSREKLHTILKISGIDIFGCSIEEREAIYNSFSLATLSLKFPHKYIFATAFPSLSNQIEYINHKISTTKGNDYVKALLMREKRRFVNLENNHKDKVAYLCIFAEANELNELEQAVNNYCYQMTSVSVYRCDNDEYTAIMSRILSFTDRTDKSECDSLNAVIQPEKITFSNNYFKVNEKYVTSIVATDFPSFINDLLLANYCNRFPNTIVTLDVNSTREEMIRHLKNSLSELSSRDAIPQNYSDRIDNANQLQELQQLYVNLTRGDEKIITCTLRFYLSADSFDDLNNLAENIKTELDNIGIKVQCDTNNMKYQFQSLCNVADDIQTPFPLHDTFKKQYPFYFQSHIDENSYLFGDTATGGIALLNNFLNSPRNGRDSYDALILGSKGAGKTVTLKSMLQSNVILGNKVMVLDVENEYRKMAELLGGQVIDMNNKSIINVLQLSMTIDNDAEDDVQIDNIYATNFASEISRIRIFFSICFPDITKEQLADLTEHLCSLYDMYGITKTTDLTQLSPKEFPTLSEFYEYLKDKDGELARAIKSICVGTFAELFNGHTTIDISNNNFIVFNVKTITEMETEICNALLFNILMIMWAEITKNREYNNYIKDKRDMRYIACLIDEAHRFINTKNMQVTEFIEKLLRRARKYFAGLWFATQSINDFNVSATTDNSEKIKTIFSLCQYKMLMKQPNDVIETLKLFFGSQFTDSELASLPHFIAGNMLFSITSGRQKVTVNKYVAKSDLLYMGTITDVKNIIAEVFEEYYGGLSKTEVYGYLSEKELRLHFEEVFTVEVLEKYGFTKETSAILTEIVQTGVKDFVVQKLNEGGENYA